MENVIYWEGKPVGIECGNYIAWFSSAPIEAIEFFQKEKDGGGR